MTDTAIFSSGKWGTNGEAYVDGYNVIYWGVPTAVGDQAKLEQNVVAIQDKQSGKFFAAPGWKVETGVIPTVRDKFLVNFPQYLANDPNGIQDGANVTAITGGIQPVSGIYGDPGGIVVPFSQVTRGVLGLTITVTDEALAFESVGGTLPAGAQFYVYGRYNSESDFNGNYLGEVEIRM